MIGFISDCVIKEAKQFLLNEGVGAQILKKTDFKSLKQLPDKNLPLVLLAIEPATDSYQWPGGLTFLSWKWGFHSYAYSPDSYNDDNTGYSNELLSDPIDTIRRHFSIGGLGNGLVFSNAYLNPGIIYQVTGGSIIYDSNIIADGQYFTCNDLITTFTTTNGGYCVGTSWLTQGMVTIFNLFGFQFTLSGIDQADQIDESGLILGYKIAFESVALDDKTILTQDTVVLETFTQINVPNEWILATGAWVDFYGQLSSRWIDEANWID